MNTNLILILELPVTLLYNKSVKFPEKSAYNNTGDK